MTSSSVALRSKSSSKEHSGQAAPGALLRGRYVDGRIAARMYPARTVVTARRLDRGRTSGWGVACLRPTSAGRFSSSR